MIKPPDDASTLGAHQMSAEIVERMHELPDLDDWDLLTEIVVLLSECHPLGRVPKSARMRRVLRAAKVMLEAKIGLPPAANPMIRDALALGRDATGLCTVVAAVEDMLARQSDIMEMRIPIGAKLLNVELHITTWVSATPLKDDQSRKGST
jgi:hypothetical protein